MNLEEVIAGLSTEERDRLFRMLRRRRIEDRRDDILANAQSVFEAVETGTAIKGTFEELKSYLLETEECDR